jgi:nitrite reductase (NADH) small subunit
MEQAWIMVCKTHEISSYSGMSAFVLGRQVAIFRVSSDFYAISDFDPFSGAYVLSRGMVEKHKGVVKVGSPNYGKSFNLATGECLEDPSVKLPTYPTRVVGEVLQISLQKGP